ncbi:hypothetical protein [Endozoicomonas sp. 4G]|uniref:hypothetical protein n=1 Tax=Endozoicomonas sp. 4G TaxID=2872754 RepID=UPI0020788854|nr:hypothetical protein [Endozoicomonas sp. 4G]
MPVKELVNQRFGFLLTIFPFFFTLQFCFANFVFDFIDRTYAVQRLFGGFRLCIL